LFALGNCTSAPTPKLGCEAFRYTKDDIGKAVWVDAVLYYDDSTIVLPESKCKLQKTKLFADFDDKNFSLDEQLFEARSISGENLIYGVRAKIHGTFRILHSEDRPDGVRYIDIDRVLEPKISRIDLEYKNSLIPVGQ
jgi:hypothetical protein